MATQGILFLGVMLLLAAYCPLVPADLQADLSEFRLYNFGNPVRQDAAVNTYNLSAECDAEIERLLHSDPKTLKTDVTLALDAFGKPRAGILQLNFGWLGHYDECMAIEGFNYCLVDMALNTTMLSQNQNTSGGSAMGPVSIKWGICPPTNCSENDIHAVITHLLAALKILESVNIPIEALSENSVVCTKDPPIPYDAGVILTILLCGFIASLMIIGALYDEFLKLQAKKPLDHRLRAGIARPWRLLDETDEADDDDVPLLRDAGTGTSINRESVEPLKQSLAVRILMCFALNRNVAKLMDTKQGDKSIGCLNGIRVISMSWVMLGHTLVFAFVADGADNTRTALDWIKSHPGFQAIANAFFSVDSFFFLSGFLLAYLTFGRFRELRTVKTWLLFYFHRYWRLTPLFAFTILVWMYIPQFFGDGPFAQTFAPRPFCTKYWWTDLLYIGNFWPKSFGEECIAWSWYLANDMQFFVISPLLMAPLFYFPIFGWLALFGTLIASFISTGLIMGLYDLQINSLPGGPQAAGGADYSSLVYSKPYCRIAPYLVGIGLGYIMHRIGKRKVRMSPVLVLIGWLVAAGMALSVVYGLYPSYHTPLTRAAIIVYGSISRFVWALSLAWVVFACKYGYGGWINNFLSWSAWVPLARVTYSAYMFHPIVILVFYSNLANSFHFSVYLLAFYFAGCVSISYFLAVLVALAIEYPFANLEKLFLPTPIRAKKAEDINNGEIKRNEVVTVVTPPAENGIKFRSSAYERGMADSKAATA